MSGTDVILFYSTGDYFQAQKFVDEKDREVVRRAKTPMLAARIGRDRKRKLRRDWESAKVSVMRDAVEAKFRQHPDLQELLLSTGDAKLIEHADNDDFWGTAATEVAPTCSDAF